MSLNTWACRAHEVKLNIFSIVQAMCQPILRPTLSGQTMCGLAMKCTWSYTYKRGQPLNWAHLNGDRSGYTIVPEGCNFRYEHSSRSFGLHGYVENLNDDRQSISRPVGGGVRRGLCCELSECRSAKDDYKLRETLGLKENYFLRQILIKLVCMGVSKFGGSKHRETTVLSMCPKLLWRWNHSDQAKRIQEQIMY